MRIDEVGRIGNINPYRKNQGNPPGSTGKKDSQKDELSISPEAKELLNGGAADGTKAGDKVQQLKDSVESGTYHVDSGKIAEKLWPYLK